VRFAAARKFCRTQRGTYVPWRADACILLTI
jgi:hypothetical protein